MRLTRVGSTACGAEQASCGPGDQEETPRARLLSAGRRTKDVAFVGRDDSCRDESGAID